ncbi:MAG TPA: glycosyltransferase family 2 protein [Planctomycetaceae bacterium]|nr:glycosyltransferase family 2 protein [Planctomycetaceae bacterium]
MVDLALPVSIQPCCCESRLRRKSEHPMRRGRGLACNRGVRAAEWRLLTSAPDGFHTAPRRLALDKLPRRQSAVADEAELSVVIPVYNGARTIGAVVDAVHCALSQIAFEIVLVNDGSSDDSEAVCLELVERYPGTVSFLQLARNFGEHSAVLAGLRRTAGRYVALMDDDGQNPPDQLPVLLDSIRASGLDVVYGHYRDKRHHWFRNLGSRFANRVATAVLHKPRDLYLSSFKVMSRFVVDAVVAYRGAFPYIDGLILQTTARVGQVEVEHRERQAGRSGYTLRKLLKLWSNLLLGFSIAPLRLAVVVGLAISALSVLLLFATILDKLFFTPHMTFGIPTVLCLVTLFAGVQLFVLGLVGEYVGRTFLHVHGQPQVVIRYERSGDEPAECVCGPADSNHGRTGVHREQSGHLARRA